MSKKCLITGGAGFIGSHLAEELVKEVMMSLSLITSIKGKINIMMS